jgi:starvation-inducible outer membrane lipoprotein
LIVILCLHGLLTGCATGIPSPLAGQVSWDVALADLGQHPEAYRGRVVALGGIVTRIEAVAEGFRLGVDALPLELSSRYRPAVDQPPKGRFIVLLHDIVLPSGLRPGAEVTIVGEVLGVTPLGEAEVDGRAPLLDGRHVKVWGPSWWPRFQISVWGVHGV